MKFYTHGHLRADAITRTGVIEPYYVRQISPVTVARHVIDPFLWSVRETGFEALAPWEVQTASVCADLMAQGKSVDVTSGNQTVTVKPGDMPPLGTRIGAIIHKAYEFMRNRASQMPMIPADDSPQKCADSTPRWSSRSLMSCRKHGVLIPFSTSKSVLDCPSPRKSGRMTR